MYVPRKWGGNGRVRPVLLLERQAPVAKRHPTQMGTGKYIPNRLIAWLEISNTARAGYRNRQDCNLIGVSRAPGETKEWTTSRSYPPILLFVSFRVPRGSFRSVATNVRCTWKAVMGSAVGVKRKRLKMMVTVPVKR